MPTVVSDLRRDLGSRLALPSFFKVEEQWDAGAAKLMANASIDQMLAKDVIPFIQGLNGANKVLDLGCGVGGLSRLAIQSGAKKVVGIDSSKAVFAKAVELGTGIDNLSFTQGDVTTFKAGASTVDAVLAVNIAQYLDKEQLSQMMKTAYASLREGGKLLLVVPSSINTTFTTQVNEASADKQMNAGIDRVNQRLAKKPIFGGLNDLVHIMREELSFPDTVNQACFSLEGGRIMSLDPKLNGHSPKEIMVEPGDIIYRKEGLMVTSERFHEEDTYINAAITAGFRVSYHKEHGDMLYRRTTTNTPLDEITKPHYGSAYENDNQYLTLVLKK